MAAMSVGDLTRGRVSGGRPYMWHRFGGRFLTRLEAHLLHVAMIIGGRIPVYYTWQLLAISTCDIQTISLPSHRRLLFLFSCAAAAALAACSRRHEKSAAAAAAEHCQSHTHINEYQPYYRLNFRTYYQQNGLGRRSRRSISGRAIRAGGTSWPSALEFNASRCYRRRRCYGRCCCCCCCCWWWEQQVESVWGCQAS